MIAGHCVSCVAVLFCRFGRRVCLGVPVHFHLLLVKIQCEHSALNNASGASESSATSTVLCMITTTKEASDLEEPFMTMLFLN